MGAIFLHYPNHTSPTVTVQLNPALVVVQPYRVAPQQRLLISESGVDYVYKKSTIVPNILEMLVDELHKADIGGFAGLTTLYNFIRTTLDYKMLTCSLTDRDGVVTTVRWMGPEFDLREGEGESRRAERYGGTIMWLKSVVV